MILEDTPISDLCVIQPHVFKDERGCFFEAFNMRQLEMTLGFYRGQKAGFRFLQDGDGRTFVQDNVSVSKKGVIRGLHFQRNPAMQLKLVSCLDGEIFDVAVDLRRSSPTYGKWHGELLTSENHRMLLVPVGFAHGFAVRSERAVVLYKCNRYYSPVSEGGVRWDDPGLGIEWGVSDPILSTKDRVLPCLSEMGDNPTGYYGP